MSQVVLAVTEPGVGDHATRWAVELASRAGVSMVEASLDEVSRSAEPGDGHRPLLVVVPVTVGEADDVPGRPDRRERERLGDLARSASSPLAMVPPGEWSHDRVDERPVMVGVDGSDANRSVLSWARWLATQLDERLIAVYVSDPADRTLTAGDRPTAEDIAVHHEIDHSGAEFVERQDADPANSLCEYAAIRGAGVLVVGARVRHSLHGRIIGPVTTGVIAGGRGPVVVVPREYQLAGT